MQKNKTSLFITKIYPWLVISICGAFLIYKYILQVYPSIMTNELMKAFQIHGEGLGNLAATFFYAYLITQFFVGILLDKYSTRLLSTLAIAVSALGAFIFAKADQLWVAEISRAMMGFGAAFATVSYLKITTVWFRANQFAFVSGLLATAAMLGAVFGQAPLSVLTNLVGWRGTLVFCGIIGLVIAVLFVLVVRDNRNGHESDLTPTNAKYRLQWSDIFDVLRNKQNWLLTFYSGLAFSPVAVFGGLWGNPFLEITHHLTRTGAASLISLIFFGLAFGGPIFGWLSDYVFKKRITVMFIGTLVSLVSIIVVIYMNLIPLWLVGILLFTFGFSTGAFMLSFAVGKEINKLSLVATVIALINSGDAILGSITEPLIGKFLDLGWEGQIVDGVHYFSSHNYHCALLLIPIYLIIALILLLFIQESKSHPVNEPAVQHHKAKVLQQD